MIGAAAAVEQFLFPAGGVGSSFALRLLNSRDGGRAGGALCEKTDKLIWSQSRCFRMLNSRKRDSQPELCLIYMEGDGLCSDT